MNAVYNPEVAADKAHERYPKGNGQFEALTLDTAFPETARVFAEKTVAQTREVYDRSKDALEAAVDTMEKSFDAAGQGAVALNRKIIDIAQRNVNSGFDLANSLAGRQEPRRDDGATGRPIGVSSSARSRPKPRKSARCRPR